MFAIRFIPSQIKPLHNLSPYLFCIHFNINCLIHLGFPTCLFLQIRMHRLVNYYVSFSGHVERRTTCGEVHISRVIKRIFYICGIKPNISKPKLAIRRIKRFTSTQTHTFACFILLRRAPGCKNRRPSLQMLHEARSYLIRTIVT
jgi:hypothetical protein